MKFVDLFCGMGGASQGAHMAGADVALAVDGWAEALEVHAKNHPECSHVLTQLPCDDLPFPDGDDVHIHASPPCQSFSSVNQASGDADKESSSDLIRWAIDVCRSRSNTWTLEQVNSPCVRATLDKMGVEYDLFDVSKFGVAQTRKRIIAGTPEVVRRLRSAALCCTHTKGVADLIEQCRGTHVRSCNVNVVKYVDGVMVKTRIKPGDFRFARPLTEPAYTVTGNSRLRWYDERTGTGSGFNSAELAALQGFPADYHMHPVKKHAYIQLGNAVPPPLMRAIVTIATDVQNGVETILPLPTA